MLELSVPVWSGVNVAGVRLKDLITKSKGEVLSDAWKKEIHDLVVQRFILALFMHY